MIRKFLDVLIGEPLANEQQAHEKYNVPFGLAIMASDAISSVAYAAEEILYVLIAVIGLMSYVWLGWVSLMIIGLLIILTVSYIQIIRAYPQGGGAYVVAKENLGVKAGLIAGASLLIDYILTVAVSASSGVAAIVSAFPSLGRHTVALVVGLITILTILNLRGVSESSKIFSIPTYLFILSMIFMIIYGMIKFSIHGAPTPMVNEQIKASGAVSIFLILRAFSSGCSALTGLEAVSNSVPNFKEPRQKSAITVMVLLSALILFIFGGTSLLARFYHAVPVGYPTVIAQIAYGVFGKTFMFYVVQFTTAVILLMACNTAFTGFPMLMYVVGKDGFAPRQFTIRGKRLSFSTGIVALSFVACVLVIIFNATTHRLIPLYSVGVFLSFTLAQTGMVIHWRSVKEPGWKKRAFINGFGAFITIITTLIITFEKFAEGAWIVAILIPLIVLGMTRVKRHYNRVADFLRTNRDELAESQLDRKFTHIMIVPIESINKAALNALQYARSITPDVIALNVSTSKEAMEKLQTRWKELNTDILLVSKYSPYRAVVTPLIKYISDIAEAAGENEKITVVLPEFIVHEWWGEFLHNHTSFFIRETLLRNENVIITTHPYHLGEDEK
ncbi:APC family permease [Clostridium aciditolerans]|uniref:APC family permease n=1 Tax=Clostridium aciditolerans TaxID=339861 RepID=A0A934HX42_9CLOT|nr:APC family permease [Clostridium aciditolerans]MBI6872192.1 APC family permease [Clostridium aciditolerans]